MENFLLVTCLLVAGSTIRVVSGNCEQMLHKLDSFARIISSEQKQLNLSQKEAINIVKRTNETMICLTNIVKVADTTLRILNITSQQETSYVRSKADLRNLFKEVYISPQLFKQLAPIEIAGCSSHTVEALINVADQYKAYYDSIRNAQHQIKTFITQFREVNLTLTSRIASTESFFKDVEIILKLIYKPTSQESQLISTLQRVQALLSQKDSMAVCHIIMGSGFQTLPQILQARIHQCRTIVPTVRRLVEARILQGDASETVYQNYVKHMIPNFCEKIGITVTLKDVKDIASRTIDPSTVRIVCELKKYGIEEQIIRSILLSKISVEKMKIILAKC